MARIIDDGSVFSHQTRGPTPYVPSKHRNRKSPLEQFGEIVSFADKIATSPGVGAIVSAIQGDDEPTVRQLAAQRALSRYQSGEIEMGNSSPAESLDRDQDIDELRARAAAARAARADADFVSNITHGRKDYATNADRSPVGPPAPPVSTTATARQPVVGIGMAAPTPNAVAAPKTRRLTDRPSRAEILAYASTIQDTDEAIEAIEAAGLIPPARKPRTLLEQATSPEHDQEFLARVQKVVSDRLESLPGAKEALELKLMEERIRTSQADDARADQAQQSRDKQAEAKIAIMKQRAARRLSSGRSRGGFGSGLDARALKESSKEAMGVLDDLSSSVERERAVMTERRAKAERDLAEKAEFAKAFTPEKAPRPTDFTRVENFEQVPDSDAYAKALSEWSLKRERAISELAAAQAQAQSATAAGEDQLRATSEQLKRLKGALSLARSPQEKAAVLDSFRQYLGLEGPLDLPESPPPAKSAPKKPVAKPAPAKPAPPKPQTLDFYGE